MSAEDREVFSSFLFRAKFAPKPRDPLMEADL